MLGAMAADGLGLASMMFYIFVYVVSNLGAFAVINTIEENSGKISMDDYNGLHKTNPWLSFAMTLAMFSLVEYSSICRFLQQDTYLHVSDRIEFLGSLCSRIDCIDQHHYFALLLSARGESNVDQSGRTEDCLFQDSMRGTLGIMALRSRNHFLRTRALHLSVLLRCSPKLLGLSDNILRYLCGFSFAYTSQPQSHLVGLRLACVCEACNVRSCSRYPCSRSIRRCRS